MAWSARRCARGNIQNAAPKLESARRGRPPHSAHTPRGQRSAPQARRHAAGRPASAEDPLHPGAPCDVRVEARLASTARTDVAVLDEAVRQAQPFELETSGTAPAPASSSTALPKPPSSAPSSSGQDGCRYCVRLRRLHQELHVEGLHEARVDDARARSGPASARRSAALEARPPPSCRRPPARRPSPSRSTSPRPIGSGFASGSSADTRAPRRAGSARRTGRPHSTPVASRCWSSILVARRRTPRGAGSSAGRRGRRRRGGWGRRRPPGPRGRGRR